MDSNDGIPALGVLNPGGRDRFQSFENGPGSPGDPGHAPVNFHAYAACTRGVFADRVSALPPHVRGVIVLLRPRHLARARAACRELRRPSWMRPPAQRCGG